MRRFIPVPAITALVVAAAISFSGAVYAQDAAENEYEVLSPWADVDPIPVRGISPRIDTLAGKKIGLFANFKRAAVPIANEVEKRLQERFPDAEFDLFHSTLANVDESVEQNKEKFEAWAKGVDAVVADVGDWGSCTKFLAYNGVAIEDFGTPVVLLANRGFVTDAKSAASGKGMPGIRVLGTTIACESTVAEDIRSGIDAVLDDIIAALTRPLTEEEKNPKIKKEEQPRIAFKGTLVKVNEYYYRMGWGDGLPIIPPTEEAVAEMLQGTDLPPDHVVTKLIPRMGKATVEKIAVNAVMAGALPTHMPVLIAAVDALSDPKTRFDTFEVSTGSWAPLLVINGPIRNDIHVNTSSGMMSPGDIANATIGRALGLIVKNIGGARKGREDMGTLGDAMKYSLVIGENEEESPWEPLHVGFGYEKDDSTVTVMFPNGYRQTIPSETNADGIAATLAGMRPGALSCMLVIPDHAKIFDSEGWSKKKVKEFIMQNSERRDSRRSGRLQDEDFMIVVAGGPGVWMGLLQSAGGFDNYFVHRKIEFPDDWETLKKKYGNMVPTYVKY